MFLIVILDALIPILFLFKQSQLRVADSAIRWAKSTRNIRRIEIGAPYPNRSSVQYSSRFESAKMYQSSNTLNISSIPAVASPANSDGQLTSRSMNLCSDGQEQYISLKGMNFHLFCVDYYI